MLASGSAVCRSVRSIPGAGLRNLTRGSGVGSHHKLPLLPMKRLLLLLATPILLLPASQAGARSDSARIDSLLAEIHREQGIEPNPITSDAVFLRRAYLDIVGRIPTKTEAVSFLHSEDPGKRIALIDSLLESEGHVNHFFHFWADLLRLNRTVNNGAFITPFYARYLADSIRSNKPYDQFVRELLTTDGAAWDSGAIGYYLRDRGMPLDNMSNTTRIFLGTRLECAQCHDHPFDEWTQLDYYRMAAFSYDMQSNYRSPYLADAVRYLRHRAGRPSVREREAMRAVFRETTRPLRYTSIRHGDRDLSLPPDYQYDNANPGAVIEPKAIFGPAAAPDLEGYAAWLTSPENPRFTKVIANRLWKYVFGRGLIEPVDDLTSQTRPSHPELMVCLEDRMKAFDYDLREFLRMLYHTRLYQRESTSSEVLPGELYHFPGPLLERMTAEQIWDSFVTLINPTPDVRPPADIRAEDRRLETAHKVAIALDALEPAELIAGIRSVAADVQAQAEQSRELTARMNQARAEQDRETYQRLARQARTRRALVRRKVSERIYERGWEQAVADGTAARELGEEVAGQPFADPSSGRMGMSSRRTMMRARTRGDREHLRAELERYRALGRDLGISDRKEMRGFVEFMRKMVPQAKRAAYLPSPAPIGHFLREFGQSDRIVIDNASRKASLPQALQLLNGPYAEALVNEYGTLAREVLEESTPNGRLDVLFLSLYSRYPTPAERDYFLPRIEKYGEKTYKDIVYAILNTQQFLFIR